MFWPRSNKKGGTPTDTRDDSGKRESAELMTNVVIRHDAKQS